MKFDDRKKADSAQQMSYAANLLSGKCFWMRDMKWAVIKIMSGGQTGADRAALDFAIAHDLEHGGWCPKGRRAEDGRIPSKYKLKETPKPAYVQRTEWNVRESGGTIIFSCQATLRGGSKKTMELARKSRKPVLHLWRGGGAAGQEEALLRFCQRYRIRVLNIAGPRASEEPAIGRFVRAVLENAFLAARRD